VSRGTFVDGSSTGCKYSRGTAPKWHIRNCGHPDIIAGQVHAPDRRARMSIFEERFFSLFFFQTTRIHSTHNTHTCRHKMQTEALHTSSEITTWKRQQPRYYKKSCRVLTKRILAFCRTVSKVGKPSSRIILVTLLYLWNPKNMLIHSHKVTLACTDNERDSVPTEQHYKNKCKMTPLSLAQNNVLIN